MTWPYVRGNDGVWRYEWGGPVPGARDLTLGDLYQPPTDDGDTFEIPIDVARRPEMAWSLAYWDPRHSDVIVVPRRAWNARHHHRVGMDAPELSGTRLLDIDAVAARTGLTARTVANYLARRLMPLPVVRLGGSPLWPAPIIDHWVATRPGRPGRPPGPRTHQKRPKPPTPRRRRRNAAHPAPDTPAPVNQTPRLPAPAPPLDLDAIDAILDRHDRGQWQDAEEPR